MQTVAILGFGNMGAGMAGRLLSGGYPTIVFNRSGQRAQMLAREGASIAPTAKQAAEKADIVLCMVSDDHASRAMWTGKEGALAGSKPGTIFIESSTLSIPWVRELAAAAAAQNCHFLDAPVTGSKAEAEAGKLLFLVGGDPLVVGQARAVFECMGRGFVHLGSTGSGALMKLVNNFLAGVQAAALGEAMALIEESDLERDKALEILCQGAPGSPIIRALAPRMMERHYTPQFRLNLMAKDLQYVLEEAHHKGKVLRTAESALKLFFDAVAKGWGNDDLSAVIEPMRRGGGKRQGSH